MIKRIKKFFSKLNIRQRVVLIAYVSIIAVGLIYYMGVRKAGDGFDCIIYQSTGLYCPGCGLTRSCLNLINGDFSRAFRNHPLFVVTAIMSVVLSVFAVIGRPKIFTKNKTYLAIFIVVIILWIVFFVLRNISGFELLQPLAY